jgi:hypothetical protein
VIPPERVLNPTIVHPPCDGLLLWVACYFSHADVKTLPSQGKRTSHRRSLGCSRFSVPFPLGIKALTCSFADALGGGALGGVQSQDMRMGCLKTSE